jgi:hypothetical protein
MLPVEAEGGELRSGLAERPREERTTNGPAIPGPVVKEAPVEHPDEEPDREKTGHERCKSADAEIDEGIGLGMR